MGYLHLVSPHPPSSTAQPALLGGRPLRRRFRAGLVVGGAIVATAALVGCSGPDEAPRTGERAAPPPSAGSGAGTPESPGSSVVPVGAALPSVHVHAAGFDPGDGALVLATHDGLFRYDGAGEPQQVGPGMDLMGFTVAGPGRYHASGHPEPGSDLPEPMGLITSTDAGATWSEVSRGGVSDFHALTTVDGAVFGFDGALRTSADGKAWSTLSPPVTPFALAGAPGSPLVLATSEDGLVRSVDAGATWSRVDAAPLLQVAAVVDEAGAVGVTPAGEVAVSEDAGVSWEVRANAGQSPQAVGARRSASGEVEVVVVTGSGLVGSTDGARSFTPGWHSDSP